MELNHANKVLGIFISILEDASISPGASHLEVILHYLKLLNDEQHEKMLVYLKEWNTNSKYSYVCHIVLSALTTIKSSETLIASKVLTENLDGLIAYSERHFQRINRLFESSYILEYVAGQISLLPIPEDTVATTDIEKKRPNVVEDNEDIDLSKIFGRQSKKRMTNKGWSNNDKI